MKIVTSAIVATLLASSLFADEIEEQIKLGLESYQSGDSKTAIEDLNYAIAKLQEKVNAENAMLLPEPLKGWSAKKVENGSGAMSMLGGGTQMSRTYTRGDERIKISVMSGPMVGTTLAMINNPMLLGNSPDTTAYRYKRYKGMKRINGDAVEVMLSVAGQIMVQIDAKNVKEADKVIESYLGTVNFTKLKAALL